MGDPPGGLADALRRALPFQYRHGNLDPSTPQRVNSMRRFAIKRLTCLILLD